VRVTLIHNPTAGQGEAGAESLVKLLRDAGHEVRYQSAKDDAWDRALEAPADLIAAAGGDGTVSRVARRMVGRGIPVAPLPLGTANNIARTLGAADLSLEEIVRGWRNPRRIKLDVGIAEGPWGERQFLEGVGIGLFATLLAHRNAKKKAAKSDRPADQVTRALRILKKRVETCEAIELQASLDGEDISGSYLLLEALNILYVGPNLFLAPESKPGDGTFDVVMAAEAERDRLLEYLSKWQDNRERLAVLPSRRGKRLRLEWTGFSVHIDDKLWPKKKHKPPSPPAAIEVRIGGRSVEFLTAP
jgi:diacylglycerol kinase family enzyme